MYASMADQIRAHVNEAFIKPARAAGLRTVSVRAGDVHKDLGLENRMPAVCSALDGAKFQDMYGVTVNLRVGPPQGSTVTWVVTL
jgi:5-methylcytosine-specific restriction protein B